MSKNPIRNQKGQTLIEYLIIVALLGVGSIVMMRSMSAQLNTKFASIIEALGGTIEGDLSSVTVSENQHSKRKDLKNFATGTTENKKASQNGNSEGPVEKP